MKKLKYCCLALLLNGYWVTAQPVNNSPVITGADRMQVYLPMLKGKSVAVFANQTSMVNNTHLVDTLLASGIKVVKIFGPEHGFRGDADAGEHVGDAKDKKTGIPVKSLYGKHQKPTPADLNG
ncbi:MAG: exo-beta-N-acetylmuramidase NamZ domain-containing protein, partial [Ferruginibacter sp.]